MRLRELPHQLIKVYIMHIKMVSQRLFQFLLLISMFFIIINPSHSSEFNSANDMVHVSLYYESLCPYSKSFIVQVLMNFFKLDVMSIVNLHLVPYGNAFTNLNGTVNCQHGPLECYYNIIEACALEAWPLKLSVPFIYCIEAGVNGNKNQGLWESCCNRLRLNPKTIQNCYASGHGNGLLIQNGKETNRLNPPMSHTPWLLVNGQLIPDVQNLVNYVCHAYKGPLKFKACQGKMVTNSTEKMTSTQAVSLANEEVFS